MKNSQRPGARGSRHAKNLAKTNRYKADMHKFGVIQRYKDIAERVQSEAITCFCCGSLVHPSNIKKHHMLYHSSQLVDAVGQSAVKVGGALLRQSKAKQTYALKSKPSATVRLIEVDGKTMIELTRIPLLPSPIIIQK